MFTLRLPCETQVLLTGLITERNLSCDVGLHTNLNGNLSISGEQPSLHATKMEFLLVALYCIKKRSCFC